MRVKLTGLKALQQTIQRIANAVPEHVQRQALLNAGEIVADEAKRLVSVRTGNLRDSILVSDQGVGGALEGGGITVFIGPATGDGFYGHMVEFGTVHMAAEPFMRPAFDNTRAEVQQRLGDDLWRPLELAAEG